MTNTDHTPLPDSKLPWRIDTCERHDGDFVGILGALHEDVWVTAHIGEANVPSDADAAYIVKAANAYPLADKLAEALEELLDDVTRREQGHVIEGTFALTLERTAAALAAWRDGEPVEAELCDFGQREPGCRPQPLRPNECAAHLGGQFIVREPASGKIEGSTEPPADPNKSGN